jgi:DoxX-like protein
MSIPYSVLAVGTSLMVTFSGMMKVRHDPRTTRIIHEVVGVPLKFFPFLASCEFAGAIGLLVGIAWPALGLAAASGLVLYFVGAVIGHVRVGDFKGLGPAAFMLCISGACLILRVRGG